MPVPTAVLARRGKLEPAFLDPTTQVCNVVGQSDRLV